MQNTRLSRRSMLRTLGLLGGAYFLPSLGHRRFARAAEGSVPTRLLIFYTHQGTLRSKWRPRGLGGAAPTERAFELGPLHAPLRAHQDDLVVLDGLDMISAELDSSPAANAHVAGGTHALTGISRSGDAQAGGPSINIAIANALNANRPLTAIPSLEYTCVGNGSFKTGVSWSGAGEYVPAEADANKAFDRLFPGGHGPDGDLARARRDQSVLDLVKDELQSVKNQLATDDRRKLEAHADQIRDLEARLALSAGLTCEVPERMSLIGDFDGACPYGAGPTCLDRRTEIFTRLGVTALACDLTRVVTIDIEQLSNDAAGYTPGMFGTSALHDLIHKTAENGGLRDNADAVAVVQRLYVGYARYLANTLQMLKDMPDADGNSLLHNTVVLWCGQIASGSHDLHLLPWMLAGQAGGALRTGRYLQLPRQTRDRGFPTTGLPHNNLLVSVANMMGVPMRSFGNGDACTGPLEGLL